MCADLWYLWGSSQPGTSYYLWSFCVYCWECNCGEYNLFKCAKLVFQSEHHKKCQAVCSFSIDFSNTVTTTTVLIYRCYGCSSMVRNSSSSSSNPARLLLYVFALLQQHLLRRIAWSVASSPHSVRRTWNCYTARERLVPRWTSADSVLCLLNGHHHQLCN